MQKITCYVLILSLELLLHTRSILLFKMFSKVPIMEEEEEEEEKVGIIHKHMEISHLAL